MAVIFIRKGMLKLIAYILNGYIYIYIYIYIYLYDLFERNFISELN